MKSLVFLVMEFGFLYGLSFSGLNGLSRSIVSSIAFTVGRKLRIHVAKDETAFLTVHLITLSILEVTRAICPHGYPFVPFSHFSTTSVSFHEDKLWGPICTLECTQDAK